MSWARALFEPRCVAVYGSVAPRRIGRVLIDQLLDGGFENVIAVNPKGLETHGVHAVSSLGELPIGSSPVDLVIVASPASTVEDVLEDAGRAGVKVALIITAGFSESGNSSGEQALLRVARRFAMRIVGPNCAGVVNTKHGLFPTLETRPPVGDVAFVSQSGALGGAVLSWAEEQGVGFSKFVSYGNAADLTEIDFLDALREDKESRVVCLYIETVSDGRGFLRAATELSAMKPLIVIKSGRSSSGGRATLSHTGSMAGADAVYDAALRQCGAIRAAGIEEMFDLCRGFVDLPPMTGQRLAIVTNSGGPGVLAADRAEAEGLDVAAPSNGLRARLEQKLPAFCGFDNPFDLTVQGDGTAYRDVLTEVLGEYDGALAINVNVPYLDSAPLAQGVVEAARATGKPIAASFMAGRPAAAALPVLEAGGVPNFVTGERSAFVLARMAEYGHPTALAKQVQATAALAGTYKAPSGGAARDTARLPLPWDRSPTEPEAMDWLEEQGISIVPHTFAATAEDAVEATRSFDQPVAMKIVATEILHKTDVGGVVLSLEEETAIRDAFEQLQRIGEGRGFRGVLISPMVEDSTELLVGLTQDPQFGPVIAVGLGGVYTEILGDLSLRIAPIDRAEAGLMLKELHSHALLTGVRSEAPRDRDALIDLLVQISELPFRVDSIDELDLNPVFARETGYWVGDVRLIRSSTETDNAKEQGAA